MQKEAPSLVSLSTVAICKILIQSRIHSFCDSHSMDSNMSLYQALKRAVTEEDVKDAYIRAIGLKQYSKSLIDIRTAEVWFEAKEKRVPPADMFAQLLDYVRQARKKGEPIPPFLSVINREEAAIMPTEKALPLIADKSIKWPKSASKVTKELIKK